MAINLYDHQKLAVKHLKTGSILCGDVGSGKSRAALAYFYTKECGGDLEFTHEPTTPKDLYIITTARKRDTLEWEGECSPFSLSTDKKHSICGIKVTIDSWNKIESYKGVTDAFFIFDEQRVIGYGKWSRTFIKIAKNNNWILLTATPGDTWMDYIPVFIANGFYKNKSEFVKRHVVYNPFIKYPVVDHYTECGRLVKLRQSIMIRMNFVKDTVRHNENIYVPYNKKKYNKVLKDRWNIYEDCPIQNVSLCCSLLRRVVNESNERLNAVRQLVFEHPKTIIFYNFDYELEMLRTLKKHVDTLAEWNGHVHEEVPTGDSWIYLVQYSAGSEAWNCITTNAIIFYSPNYSYRVMHQASGRIDRMNTPYTDLYYYHILTKSSIDNAIVRTLKHKKTFNEKAFMTRLEKAGEV